MSRLATLAVVAAVVIAMRTDARACSIAGPTAHVVYPSMAATDQVPPTLPLPTVTVSRGKREVGCGGRNTCDNIGNIRIAVAATDDTTPAERIGYRLTLEGFGPPNAGGLPRGLTLPTDAVDPVAGEVVLVWDDIADGEAEDFYFVVSVVAVDLAGNQSEPQLLPIGDGRGGDCSIAGGDRSARAPAVVAAVAFALAAFRRRRRR
jgi:MYXO-CTERM domain-containing protein